MLDQRPITRRLERPHTDRLQRVHDARRPPTPDLTDDQWDFGSSDGEIFSSVKNGTPPDLFMGPWDGRLTDTEMWNVVNYIRSLAKKK